ncbi:MAG: YdeI/OmpD-associated family protein [Pseudomonadales bacterium]|nr:YdeI/OmpD-associated family protein [Pseudomonadales bacterium]
MAISTDMKNTNAKVDAWFAGAGQWAAEMAKLRRAILSCGLEEELKWRKPCYTYDGSNIAIIQPFKQSCAVMFFKGALLKQGAGVLEAPGENSRIARRIVFMSADDVERLEKTLKACLREAIEIEKAGLKVETSPEVTLPEELTRRLGLDPALNAAFRSLTPGRQRAYALHIAGAKQSSTRESRIDKCSPGILAGKGLNDR